MDAYPIYEKQTGRIAAAGYLRDKQGIKPGVLSRVYNALSSLNTSEVQAKERVKNILDMVYATKSGKELMESAAGGKISIAFNPAFQAHYATIKHNVITVSPQDSDDYLANIVVHELYHARQEQAIRAAFGSQRYFYETAKSFADTAYPMLIGEADAYAGQTINAYEMHLQGIPGPWRLQKFAHRYQPLSEALEDQLKRGNDLYSDATRQAIFRAWMISPELRGGYDTEYLSDMPYMRNPGIDLNVAGVSHNNKDLIRIADDANGHSYLKGFYLTEPFFMRHWTILNRENAMKYIQGSRAGNALTEAFIYASEFTELAEDHMAGFNRWKDLPKSYSAESLLNEKGFRIFNEALKVLYSAKEDVPELKKLLSYIEDLSVRHPELSQKMRVQSNLKSQPQFELK